MIFLPDFFAEIRKIEHEMTDLLQKALGPNDTGLSYAGLAPPIDIYERDDFLIIVMDVPGIPMENLKIQIYRGFLVITGRKDAPNYHDQKNFVCLERSFGTFHRKIYIQRSVDFSDIHADLKEGILTVRIRIKGEQETAPLSIPIEVEEEKTAIEEGEK